MSTKHVRLQEMYPTLERPNDMAKQVEGSEDFYAGPST